MLMKKIVLFILMLVGFVSVQLKSFAQEQDIYFVAYMTRLQNKVKSNWEIPHGQPDKKTVVVFKINKDGKLLSSNILEKSGDDLFDQEALAAIYSSVPFEQLPNNVKDDSVEVQFVFNQDLFGATAASNVSVNDMSTPVVYVNNPQQATISSVNKAEIQTQDSIKQIKNTEQKRENINKKSMRRTSPVTPKTAGAGVLSLVIWPGLGQLVNNGPSEKAGVHAILGFITIFRFWSFYDALVNRQEGPV